MEWEGKDWEFGVRRRKLLYVCVSYSVMSDSLHSHGLVPQCTSVHGILQARILEWVAMTSSKTIIHRMDKQQGTTV